MKCNSSKEAIFMAVLVQFTGFFLALFNFWFYKFIHCKMLAENKVLDKYSKLKFNNFRLKKKIPTL